MQIYKDRKYKGGCQRLGVARNGQLIFSGYRVPVLQHEESSGARCW